MLAVYSILNRKHAEQMNWLNRMHETALHANDPKFSNVQQIHSCRFRHDYISTANHPLADYKSAVVIYCRNNVHNVQVNCLREA